MSEIVVDRAAVRAAWLDLCARTGIHPAALGAVEHLGDGPAMADELLGLVLDGRERATAGLARDLDGTGGGGGGAGEQGGSGPPVVGGYWLLVDGRGAPRCVVRTTELRTGLLADVDEAFAHDEGEGDRTRAWWLAAHRRFFARRAARDGVPFDEDVDLVAFERFEVTHVF